jgi:phage/plasmid-associated DNA primase
MQNQNENQNENENWNIKFKTLLNCDELLTLFGDTCFQVDGAKILYNKLKDTLLIHKKKFYTLDHDTCTYTLRDEEVDQYYDTVILTFVTESIKKLDTEHLKYFNSCKKFKAFRDGGNFNKNISSTVQTYLTKPNIKFDFDLNGIHFKNGRYNLQTGKLENRTSSMYITKYINHDYKESTKEELNKIDNMFNKIFREPEAKEYTLYLLGSSLSGLNVKEQKYLFNFGDGGAGKTTVFDLLYSALGDNYFVNLPKSTFEKGNGKIDKILNSITSNTRYYLVNEISDKSTDTSILKELADGKFPVTQLYKDGLKHLEVYGKLCFVGNDMINFHVDGGIKRRTEGYKYINRFSDNVKEVDNKTVYLRDKELIQQLTLSDKVAIFNTFAPYCKMMYDSTPIKTPQCFKNFTDEIIESLF